MSRPSEAPVTGSKRKRVNADRDSPPAEGFPQVLAPGQGEHATEQERVREGIPINANAATMAALQSLSAEYGVPL